jgi:hypothetical protein
MAQVSGLRPLDLVSGRSDPAAGSGVDLVRIRLLRMQAMRWHQDATRGIKDPPPRQGPPASEEAAPPPEPLIPEEDTFEDWAFGDAEGAVKFRRQLDRLLDRKVAEVRQIFGLTAVQERKLRLAGKGDLQRVLDLVEKTKREFERSRTEPDRLLELRKDLRLIELRISEGPFETGSLFTKTLRKLHDGGQLVRRPAAAPGPSRGAG